MEHHTRIVRDMRRLCWDEGRGFYFDRTRGDTLCATKNIGAFWTLLSDVADAFQSARMVGHLKNPAEFWRPHLVPTLSADDPNYEPKGHYWRGSVWAPTNYMLVKGLEHYGYYDLASEIAENHIGMMSRIYHEFVPDEERIAFEERYGDGYHTIWECYSPEYPEPASRWDNTFYSRQNFVGWSGLGPIAMLIENVLGLEIEGLKNTIRWRIHRLDRHGIEDIQLGDQKVSLICQPRASSSDLVKVDVKCEKPFVLEVMVGPNTQRHEIHPGRTTIEIR
jgi:neutral trehalase